MESRRPGRCCPSSLLACALLGAGLLFGAGDLLGQELTVAGIKSNLDLPVQVRVETAAEEDAPESIFFYGYWYEGDTFIFTIDHSGTMNDRGELAIAKREIRRNVNNLSRSSEFAINFFDIHVKRFPPNSRPVPATAGTKASALAFLMSIGRGSGTCCKEGFLEALRSARLSSTKRKLIIYVGDGGGTCLGAVEAQYLDQTLPEVTKANRERVPIHTIGVLMEGRVVQEQFLRALAAANEGTYRRLN